jgi:hypothetical protein
LQLVDDEGKEDAAAANEVVRVARDAYNLRLRSLMYGFGNVTKIRSAPIATDEEIVEVRILSGILLFSTTTIVAALCISIVSGD